MISTKNRNRYLYFCDQEEATINYYSRYASKVEKKYAEAALDQLVAGKPISQPNTKAIGCTIKWREA